MLQGSEVQRKAGAGLGGLPVGYYRKEGGLSVPQKICCLQGW